MAGWKGHPFWKDASRRNSGIRSLDPVNMSSPPKKKKEETFLTETSQ